jgi:cation:H+ antiporter
MFLSLPLTILAGVIAIAVLILAAEFVVKKLVVIAKHFGVSDTFIGLTVLSVGTSLPEIANHFIASAGILSGRLDYNIASATVLGANIGSDVIQQTLILGLVIVLIGHLSFTKKFLKTSYLVMVLTAVLCLVLGLDGTYSRFDGAVLFLSFLGYMMYLAKHEAVHEAVEDDVNKKFHIGLEIMFAFGGLLALLASSTVVLTLVEGVVKETSLGGSLIGVITLGVASALPEFFTALQGVKHKAKGISIGTLIGSNITNPLLAIGGGALISTYAIPKALILWDFPLKIVTGTLLLLYLVTHDRKLGRWGAVYLICMYIVYIMVRLLFFSVD